MAIGAIAGGIASLIGVMMQADAMNRQTELQRRALQETKRANRKTEELQRSTRRDPYGNAITFTPGVGFEFDLTALTNAILGAEQREQFANLSQDAPRNRAAAERMDKRSIEADEEFQKLFNEYRYRPRPSKQAAITDATNLMLTSRKKGLDEAANLVAKQLMRTGGSSQLASVYKQAGDTYAGSLEEAMLRGKRLGTEDYNAERASMDGWFADNLGMLKGIADQTTTSPVRASGLNDSMSGRADQALAGLTAAIEGGRGAASADAARYAAAAGQSPDMSGLAAALSKINFGGGQKKNDQEELLRLLAMSRQEPWGNWQNDFSTMRGFLR